MAQRQTLRSAIKTFLDNRQADSPFLLARYTTDLETQIMTSRDGEPTDNPGEYTNGSETWKDKRWPYQSGSNPNYNDPPISFSPAARVERVGTTWWDFVNKRSIAATIDIDFSGGHAATTNTNDETTLSDLVARLSTLDYVTIVRSTSGKGLHVYVFFDNPPDAANHHEHTIVARKTLELICHDLNYDLKRHTDCVGSVLWIWAKSSPADHAGFSLVKEGTLLDAGRLASVSIPVPAVRGADAADFELVELEPEHRRVLEAIASQGTYFNIRSDMNLIHTHTVAIKRAVDQGLIEGPFETASDGSDLATANCFMAPQKGGSFRVVRFGQTQHEPSWQWRNEKNYCFLNERESAPELVSRLAESYSRGKYKLGTSQAAEDICASLGESLTGPAPDDCFARIQACGDIFLESKKGLPAWADSGPTDGWEKRDNIYVKTIKVKQKVGTLNDRLLQRADDRIRFVTCGGEPGGWYMRTDSGNWLRVKSYGDVACLVDQMFGEFANKAHTVMLTNPWDQRCIPFQPEYPGNRVWNFNAPQLAVAPAESGGDHPYFDMILSHVGHELDSVVLDNDWCRKANIQTGADYLRTWLACLIHHTDQPLPYLFLSGPQNSGKSVFHECCRFLFTHGIASAGQSLTSNFNGELEGAFLVYVEERDLADKRHDAYSKIKEWVTGRSLTVRRLYQQTFQAPNYLHFVQMANTANHLPLEDGDTRIVALDVPALGRSIVPKAILEDHLQDEAPRFLRSLLNTSVPPPIDRLRIPTLSTQTKVMMESRAMSPLMMFCKENLYPCDGHIVDVTELYDRFKSNQTSHGGDPDPIFIVVQELTNRSDKYTLAVRGKRQFLVNVSMDRQAKPKKARIEPNGSGRF